MTIRSFFEAARAVACGACALAAATIAAGPHVAPAAAGDARTITILAFGSSSTQGVGASRPAASYPSRLEAELAGRMPAGWTARVTNRGIGGQDIDDMTLRLQPDVIARHPDIVIWQVGSNDPLRHVPLARFERETRAGIAAMQHAGITVLLMEQQWCPRLEAMRQADAYREIVRRVGAEMHVAVIRRSDMMHAWVAGGRIRPEEMLSTDGLHMRDGGYALLAREVAPVVLGLVGRPSRFVAARTQALAASRV